MQRVNRPAQLVRSAHVKAIFVFSAASIFRPGFFIIPLSTRRSRSPPIEPLLPILTGITAIKGFKLKLIGDTLCSDRGPRSNLPTRSTRTTFQILGVVRNQAIFRSESNFVLHI